MSENGSPIIFKDGIVCDDIREERSGKFVLVGVYAGSIIWAALPLDFVMAMWLPFVSSETGVFPLQFRAIGPHGVQYVSADTPVTVNTAGEWGSLTIRGILIPLQTEGEIDFQ